MVASIMLLSSIGCNAALILADGESFSASFTLESNGDAFKLTDNYWDILVPIIDSNNPPFSMPSANSSFITLTLFENTDFTSLLFSSTQDTSNWFSDFGLLFFGENNFFEDQDGSLRITYSGLGEASFIDNILVANFSGTEAPSNVAFASIVPEPSVQVPNPVPAPVGFALIGVCMLMCKRYAKSYSM